VGAYVLTAEILITGSLADDDAAMDGYHIGTTGRVEARMAVGVAATGHKRRGAWQ